MCGFDGQRRVWAMVEYSVESSIPVARCPLFRAARSVVPEPAKGSRIFELGARMVMRCSIRGMWSNEFGGILVA